MDFKLINDSLTTEAMPGCTIKYTFNRAGEKNIQFIRETVVSVSEDIGDITFESLRHAGKDSFRLGISERRAWTHCLELYKTIGGAAIGRRVSVVHIPVPAAAESMEFSVAHRLSSEAIKVFEGDYDNLTGDALAVEELYQFFGWTDLAKELYRNLSVSTVQYVP